ncbi:Microtubule-associated protein TORTIFOLIA1 [Olea europaea subsp. europaea]|uniref:Microtubule-associated protein TORTIFOLIA1 n=1 Tax=Olea europaea subsp. europaea TaxID=158383 RepID=A0A8S0SY44_OLEEU|nr:Microtubule-associated protein TORTIFOLIA1 [Olea europaea subsp. europaea]
MSSQRSSKPSNPSNQSGPPRSSSALSSSSLSSHLAMRLKDLDSQVREACCNTVGSLSALYLKGGGGSDWVASLFVKPLFEVMGENNKAAQGGACDVAINYVIKLTNTYID